MQVRWLEQRLADVSANDDWLTPAEAMRCASFRYPKRRSDWRLGRWTAKLAVTSFLRSPHGPASLAQIEIRSAASGAPEVYVDGVEVDLSISISHSSGIAACAVADLGLAIGCDLEVIETREEAFGTDYFTPTEQLAVRHAQKAERDRWLTLLWSAKESALKALQIGLAADTRDVEVRAGCHLTARDREFLKSADWSAARVASEEQETWQPLVVQHLTGLSLHGWWFEREQMVRTIVAYISSGSAVCVNENHESGHRHA